MHPVPEFLFLHWPKRDPIRLLGAELAGSQDTMFDPIVNDMAADTEVFGDLLHGCEWLSKTAYIWRNS